MDDTTIIDLYFARDEAAIRHTAEKYGGRLRALSHGIVQDMQTAEECENDTYLQAWNAIPPHDPKEYLYAFLARITRHISLNRCRDRRRLKRSAYICELSAELEQCIPAPDDAQCRLDDLALSEAINGFLGALDEEKRNLFLRRSVLVSGFDLRPCPALRHVRKQGQNHALSLPRAAAGAPGKGGLHIMRGTELLDKMELVNAAFVQAADQPPAGKRRGRIRWLAVAACFCFVAAAALALWRGSTPAQHAPALEKLRIPDLVPGGMGFEGYLYYRAAELENGNPWHEGMALSSLPVYRNAAYDASGLGIAKGLDEAQMRALLDSAVSALGAAVRSVETVTAEGADTVTELRAATDRGELRAQADGTLVYFLPDGGLALPAGYSFTVSGTTDGAARETIAYLAERYSALLRMTAPVPVTGGDYNIYGEYRRTYAVYDAGETDAEGIVNYNLCSASFVPTEDGRLGSIRIRNVLAAAETLGDYPIVSADDARQRLRAGNYQTSAPCALPEDADIAGVELVYRTGSREQLLLPYYRFYVRLPDTDMEYADGLQLYGAYYVPAVTDAYLENMPVYDGQFN